MYTYQTKYFNCIIYCGQKEGRSKSHFLKYHGIKNTDKHKGQFLQFAKEKFRSAQYVNFYDKLTKQFIERIHLE